MGAASPFAQVAACVALRGLRAAGGGPLAELVDDGGRQRGWAFCVQL